MATNNAGSCKNAMQDCRAFTDYQPNCQLESYLQSKYAPGSSSEYRQFLQNNACSLMKELRERQGFVNPTGCQCNYNHAPHDSASKARYEYQPSSDFLANRNKNFNTPIMNPGGKWTNYC